MRCKVDEDLPAEVAMLLRQAGRDVQTVRDQNLTGTPDHELWPHVQAEARLLFTADKGFADVRTYPPGGHAGIVLFRLPAESRAGHLLLVESLLARYRLEDVAGDIVVVSPASIRVHRGGSA